MVKCSWCTAEKKYILYLSTWLKSVHSDQKRVFSKTKYNILLFQFPFATSHNSKHMNEKSQHTESSHWAHRQSHFPTAIQSPPQYVPGAVFCGGSLYIAQCVETCSGIAGERTQHVQLCLQTAANSQLSVEKKKCTQDTDLVSRLVNRIYRTS